MPNPGLEKTRITEQTAEVRLIGLVRGLEAVRKQVGDITYFEGSELDDLIKTAETGSSVVGHHNLAPLPGINMMLCESVQLPLIVD